MKLRRSRIGGGKRGRFPAYLRGIETRIPGAVLRGRSHRSQPTYEGLKPVVLDEAGLYLDTFPAYLRGIETGAVWSYPERYHFCSQPTYEGLKRGELCGRVHVTGSSQPTYEGLKPEVNHEQPERSRRSQPTYEGLKL